MRIQHPRKLVNCPSQKDIYSEWRRFERHYMTSLGFQFLTSHKFTKSDSVCERPSLSVHCNAGLRRMFLAGQSWNKRLFWALIYYNHLSISFIHQVSGYFWTASICMSFSPTASLCPKFQVTCIHQDVE